MDNQLHSAVLLHYFGVGPLSEHLAVTPQANHAFYYKKRLCPLRFSPPGAIRLANGAGVSPAPVSDIEQRPATNPALRLERSEVDDEDGGS